MILNEQIWNSLDGNDHLLAAELCLFAEHIYTGNYLKKNKKIGTGTKSVKLEQSSRYFEKSKIFESPFLILKQPVPANLSFFQV